MKKKLAVIITAAVLSMGLPACGEKEEEPQSTETVMNESETSEETAAGNEENTEAAGEGNETAETEAEATETEIAEAAETAEQEKALPDFYMDEEGVKSGKLGIQIRKDSAEWKTMGIVGDFSISVPDSINSYIHSHRSFSFDCYYYEGDVDDYISEHNGMEKGEWEGIVYAYDDNFHQAAIVGNGVVFTIHIDDYEVIFENSLSVYEGDTNYLVYSEGSTLYLPALGICYSGINNRDKTDSEYDIIGIYCSGGQYVNETYEGGSISISVGIDSKCMSGNAEEELGERIEDRESAGYSPIAETVKKELGKFQFIGKGVTNKFGGENWYLRSDELNGTIDFSYTEEGSLEDYFSLIEELE